MRLIMAALAACLLVVTLASPAQAKKYKVQEFCGDRYCNSNQVTARDVRYNRRDNRRGSSYEGRVVAHPAGCPRRAFCGCGTCAKVGISLAECKRMGLFLARNWLHRFPRTSPGPGMVAARSGHVMVIVAYQGNGHATVYDPNSGNGRTRIHSRSLSGYQVVDPRRSRMALRDMTP